MVNTEQGGQRFRNTWIAGVNQYYPGTPKPGYIAPWAEMAKWEQESAIAVYEQIHQFVAATAGKTTQLSREQKGRFVCLCWIGQIYKHFESPKASYVADWTELPEWQRETDANIFEAIERDWFQEM
ncbi:hypothetical protein [Ktedonospora formicarum]|uniref:Uncharacterized protein n=1 Tax=Ktedonospora formicarum TaxID=2778364 RepID=A0A8J3MWH2_9CHLR|nr:hypothetical protein [Ktedonospora formicarum]GHO51432.1 hypothetical protein KSX_95950 [Ktedonospora formicarum]